MKTEPYTNVGEYIFDNTSSEKPILIAKAETPEIAAKIKDALCIVFEVKNTYTFEFVGVDKSPTKSVVTFWARRNNSNELREICAPHPLIYSCNCGAIGLPRHEYNKMCGIEKISWEAKIKSCKCMNPSQPCGGSKK